MGDFAVVAEGHTDQIVIRNILRGFFEDADEEPVVVFEQPLLDETAKGGGYNPGGWSLVVKYFEAKKFVQALQLNKYLVVHIDTDVSDDYGVPHHYDGKERSADELIAAVVARFRGLIGEAIFARHGERFIFAIAVDSIECWLMPLFFANKKKGKLTGCLAAIDHELKKAHKLPLARPEGKNPDSYDRESKPYTRKKTLAKHRDDTLSLGVFVRALEARSILLPTTLD